MSEKSKRQRSSLRKGHQVTIGFGARPWIIEGVSGVWVRLRPLDEPAAKPIEIHIDLLVKIKG